MRVFLLDLWLDLRAKRLAPVAILLVAGIIAVPIVLANSSEETAPPAPTTTTAAPAAPVVQSAPQAGAVESKLQTFSSRDPFEPTGKVVAATTGTGGTVTTGTGETGTGGTTGTGETGGGTLGQTGTGTTGTTTPEKKTTLFTYTVDVRFGPPGDQVLTKGVQRLELLPDATDPKIVFLGVTTSGKTAVFLVDSSLGVDTNGRCRPSSNECTFLYLRPDDEHDQAELTDQDGNTFRLHLLRIHRVTVASSTSGGNTNSGNQTGSSNRSPAFTGSADSSGQTDPTAAGDAPPGEPSQPFTFRGFFSDSEGG